MERYTEKHYGENGYYLVCSGNCETLNCGDCGILDKIVDRLAAYEDTGLEPEEVRSQKELFDYLVFDSTPSEDIERFKRLRELAEADREGRCVVLNMPRKPLVWGDDDQNTCLCPYCGKDLMGIPYGERMVLLMLDEILLDKE